MGLHPGSRHSHERSDEWRSGRWETPAVDMVPLLRNNGDIKIEVIDPLGTQGWLRPNHLHPPFDNPKARQALLYAVNQTEYLQTIVGDPALYSACAANICGTPNAILHWHHNR